jgi:pSer/pThr/pTyr-binding forkhead associated (FHA) protein
MMRTVAQARKLASLVFSDGLEREITEGITLGRAESNDVVLISKTVSRDHARLFEQESRWFVEDLGSLNGTLLNGHRIPARTPLHLRHGDRLQLGGQVLVFTHPAQAQDDERTDPDVEAMPDTDAQVGLSSLQLQVVRLLCEDWLAGGSLEELPSNAEIAARLGTPGAGETVKAALRRAYSKAGVSGLPAHTKRRALCRIARHRGWL